MNFINNDDRNKKCLKNTYLRIMSQMTLLEWMCPNP